VGKIYILDSSTGETALEWDVANAEATAIAEQKFNELAAVGNLMTEVKDGQGQVVTKKFNPEADEIVAVRNLAGG
jgi:hypothetical protein